MDRNERLENVKKALLAIQRYSWEQGVAAQAFLELGDAGMVVAMAKEAVLRQFADGRLGVMGDSTAVTDPAANGEAVLFASRVTGDRALAEASGRMLDWLLNKAPRNKDGVLYHFHDKPQIWVDSIYMAPPFLAAAGFYEAAIAQLNGYRRILYNNDKHMFSHMWDDGSNRFIRKDFWGVGNGWALAGMVRVIRALPEAMEKEREMLIDNVKDCIDGCLTYIRQDGLFHDVIDNPETFVETNFGQMLAYSLYRGMAGGWLDKSYLKYAEKMKQAVYDKVDSYGYVQGVCGSPGFDRPGTAAEGQAFFILMEAASDDFYKL